MRLMFKRPAQFMLPDGTMSELYKADEEHTVDDTVMEKIEKSRLYRRMVSANEVVFIKETAPKEVKTRKPPEDPPKPEATKKEDPEVKDADQGKETPGTQAAAPADAKLAAKTKADKKAK